MQSITMNHVHQDRLDAAQRELSAARAELASLDGGASPSRLERALERVSAAQHALALAA